MAQILVPNPGTLILAGNTLRAGELVGMPTETVYGLAARVFDERAVARIFAVKERPTFDPLIVHVSPAMLGSDPLARLAEAELVDIGALQPAARERAEKLARAFWPGPLTLVLPKHAAVPDLVTSGLSSVGLRAPLHPVAQALIDATGSPLAAPSANRFGRISPTTAAAVEAELGDRIGLILDGGPCEIGLESTVVRVSPDGATTILRPGGVSRAQLASVLGFEPANATPTSSAGLASPGMLESHYAPVTPFVLLPGPFSELSNEALAALKATASGRAAGLLLMHGDTAAAAGRLSRLTGFDVSARSLSREGDLTEIARGLFQGMRQLDEAGLSVIFAEPAPSAEGLGAAIADRLSRASRRS